MDKMKKAIIFLAVMIFVTSADGQAVPLTQPEYVKMLYALQKDRSTRDSVVEALRKRGIGFELNDGIRSFTKSKAGNDEELLRSLDEADRRRKNPQTSTMPNKQASAELLEKARKNTLEAVAEMPDFVVKQQIQRSQAFAGTNNFRPIDRLVVAVSYRSTGEEEYRLLSKNGLQQPDPQSKRSYSEVGGTSSTGEFVSMLATVFKPESDTVFEPVDTDLIRDRKTVVYDFSVTGDKAKQVITSAGTVTSESTITGIKGKVWIDRTDARVLRIDSEATEIPEGFRVRAAKRVIDYDWVTISDERYLLPALSDVRLTSREGSRNFETRNVIRFKDYQKYGTDVVIRDDDEATPTEETQ
jgi:hypothetical protein